MNIKGCLLHNSDDWKTPKKIYDAFMNKGYIDTFKYKSDKDELKNKYDREKLFINPPFSKLNEIIPWILEQAKNNTIALLIPARTDTKYFHKLLNLSPTILFIKGRLHYNESKAAPFPSIILFFKYNLLPIYINVDQEELIRWIKRHG